MTSVGERLAEERKRLSISQVKFAELVGIDRTTQRNYEINERHPNTEYLSIVSKIGIDILYVITGNRTPNHGLLQQVQRKYGPVLDMGEVGDHIERLVEAERAAGNVREREDMARWISAFDTVTDAIAQSGRRRTPPEARARLILLAYDLLEDDAVSSKERIIRLVKAT